MPRVKKKRGLIGGRSGFRTGRDLALFTIGAGILIFHVTTTPPAQYSKELFLFCGGFMGAPYVIRRDEKE